jgi:hypothetical protein
VNAPVPVGLEVTEVEAPSRDAGLPYREAGKRINTSVSMSWRTDKSNFHVELSMLLVLVGGANAAFWFQVYSTRGMLAPRLAIGLAVMMIATVWFVRRKWPDRHRVRVERHGIYWTRVAWTSFVVESHIPASEVAAIVVRDESTREGSGFEIPNYFLVATSPRGDDQTILQFTDPAKARYIASRIEELLGLADRVQQRA